MARARQAGRRCCSPRGKSLVASRLGSRVRPKPCSPHLFGFSGACVGCCLGEDANPAAAPLTRILSSRPCERRPPRRHRRRTMVVGALVPPDATRVATRVATVYTNAPKRLQEAVFSDLCTLLHPHACPQRRSSVHECPKTDSRGRFLRSVYTPAFPRSPARPGGATGPTTSTASWPPRYQGART